MVGHSSLPRSYLRDQLGYDAVRATLAIDLPMLVMQGERDHQVTADEDYDGWRRGLAARASVTFRLYPRLNHHFVAGEGKPTPAEYADPGHADVRVISDIAAWILSLYSVK